MTLLQNKKEHHIQKSSGRLFFGIMYCTSLLALDQVCESLLSLLHRIVYPVDHCGNYFTDYRFAPRWRQKLWLS